MFHLNKMSQLVTVDSGISVDAYEERLNDEGLTGGYFPLEGPPLAGPPLAESEVTLASCLASRTPNLYFLKYGGIEELCVGGKIATPSGLVFPLKTYPRAAIGPDLRRLILGTENLLGRFEEVTLRVFPVPEHQIWGLALFEHPLAAASIMRDLLGIMIKPLFVRVIDEEEGTGFLKSLALSGTQKVILAFKLAGLHDYVEACRETIAKIHEGKKIVFHWPVKETERAFLDEQLLSEPSYRVMQEKYSLLLGIGDKKNSGKAEKNFTHFFDTYSC